MNMHKTNLSIFLVASLAICAPVLGFQQQLQWMHSQQQQQPQQLQQQQQPQTDQFGNLLLSSPEQQQLTQQAQPRPPIAAELQNQVNALSAQLAAANRQLSLFQQQLSMVTNGQAQAAPQQLPQQPSAPVNEPQQAPIGQSLATDPQQQANPLFNLQQLAQFQQQQQQQQQFFAQRQPEQPIQAANNGQEAPAPVSTLVNDGATNELDEQARFSPNLDALSLQQQQQQQQQQDLQRQSQLNTTPANPIVSSIERPIARAPLQQQQQQQQQQPIASSVQQQAPVPQQAPSLNQAPPHNPARNDDKFAIGLGVLSPGYTQKFGNTALDFNQDKNGFSFTLNNNGHSNAPQPMPSPRPGQ